MEQITEKKERLYVAYGSNLNVEQMRYRCPDARVAGTAQLDGWRLMFKGSRRGYYLTIERQEGCMVPVGVWYVSEQDEASLDVYEGFPDFYYKKELDIWLREAESSKVRQVQAFVYIMHESFALGRPADSYVERCREGYRTFGFDDALLDEAYEYSCKGQ